MTSDSAVPAKFTRSHSSVAKTVLKKPVWILAHDSQDDLAAEIAELCHNSQAAGLDFHGTRNIEHKKVLRWKKFPDGFPDLFIDEVKSMAGKAVILIASFHSVDVVFEQLSIIYALPRYLAHSVTVILPYFPTGTMERVDEEGQIATANTLATLLSNVPLATGGPPQIMIFDIHALQERFYFGHGVIPRLETALPLLGRELNKMDHTVGQIAIAFPDDGAAKRFKKHFDDKRFCKIICSKTRHGNKRILQIREGDPADKIVIIVDDLIQTGGTILEAAKLMKCGKAKSVCAYVTHAVFPNESWKKFVVADKDANGELPVDKFWITDSIPHARKIAEHHPFQLLPLAPLIADILLGYDLMD